MLQIVMSNKPNTQVASLIRFLIVDSRNTLWQSKEKHANMMAVKDPSRARTEAMRYTMSCSPYLKERDRIPGIRCDRETERYVNN